MRTLLFALAALIASTGAAFAIDADSQAVVDRYKAGKLVAIDDVATLMRGSERWCYAESDGACDWTDIYVDVGDTNAVYEIANAWDDQIDIAFTDQGELRDGRYICEFGFDWVPSVRATRRADGTVLGGRELAKLKGEILANRSADVLNCFDYLFVSADADADTVTLTQRQYEPDGTTDPANDVRVTLHFNPADVEALQLQPW